MKGHFYPYVIQWFKNCSHGQLNGVQQFVCILKSDIHPGKGLKEAVKERTNEVW